MPGGPSGTEVLNRFDAVVAEVVDALRRDAARTAAAALFAHGAMLRLWASVRASDRADRPATRWAARGTLHNTAMIVLDSTADGGWRVVSWAGTAIGGPRLDDGGSRRSHRRGLCRSRVAGRSVDRDAASRRMNAAGRCGRHRVASQLSWTPCPAPPSTRGIIRVSDDERSHVLALLEKATGRGLIDLGEYTERSAKVISARTRGDLNAVLMDLPGLEIAGRSIEGAQREISAAEPADAGFFRRRARAAVAGRLGAGVDGVGIADVQGLLDGAAVDPDRRHRGQYQAGFHGRTTRLADRHGRVPVQLRRFRGVRGATIELRAGRRTATARRPHEQQGGTRPR